MTSPEIYEKAEEQSSVKVVANGVGENRSQRQKAKFSFNNLGAIYVLLAIIVVSSILMPNIFPTPETLKQVLNGNAVSALAALAIVLPMVAGVFDISFAYTMSLAGVTAAHVIVATDLGVAVAAGAGIAVGLLVGCINGVIVVLMDIDSLIGTLATGSLIQALIIMFTGGNSITDVKLAGDFASLGQAQVLGIALPVFYVVAVAFALWFLLDNTAVGRRLYATGFNRDAARLSGIRTERFRFAALVVAGGIAALAGVVLASNLGSGSTTAGTSYLLPAFAAVFLGATQFKSGMFNAWGTVVAILLLGTGLTSLALASAPNWAGDMFTGLVLIVALAIAGHRKGAVSRAE